MEVILLEKMRNLGSLGDRVKVKNGFGRNYLIPNHKAVPATETNIAKFEARRAELEQKAQAVLEQAKERANKLNALNISIEAMASDEGKLYGSVGTNEIVTAVTQAGVELEKKEVLLPEGALHYVGEYQIDIQVHTDVAAQIKLAIVAAK